jgi:hypothetical protein
LRKARAWQKCENRAGNRADAPEFERFAPDYVSLLIRPQPKPPYLGQDFPI